MSFNNFTPQHQLMAGRALAIIGVEQGVQFVDANRPPSLPRNTPQQRIVEDELDARLSAAERELVGYARKTTRGGRKMVRFFLDAMNGVIKSFSPSLRIAAAKGTHRLRLSPAHPCQTTQDRGSQAGDSETARPGRRGRRLRLRTQLSSPSTDTPNAAPARPASSSAMSRFRLTHCEQGEEIHQYIVRRAMTATQNPIQRLSEATLVWNQYMAFIRRLCPESTIAALPGWFHNLLEDDPHYPDGYNPKLVDKNYDFWMGGLDDDEWEDPDCECDDCDDDHDRDEMGNCLCPICFESEDDP